MTRYQMAGRWQQLGIGVALKKRLHGFIPFGTEDRTGAVKQSPARRQERPKRFEQLRLNLTQLGAVVGSTQPTHVRVSAHDARSGAWGIQQDGIKALTIPPTGGLGRVCGANFCANLCLNTQTLQVLTNPLAAAGIYIEGQHPGLGVTSQQVSGLATRGSTSVQDTPGLGGITALQQQRRGHLGCSILHRNVALGKAGQLGHRHSLCQLQACGPNRFGGQAQGQQLRLVFGHAVVAWIDAQAHGRGLLCHAQQALPLTRVFGLQALDPPQGVIPKGLWVGVGQGHQVFTFTHEAPQTGIDETALGVRRSLLARGFNRLVDQGVYRVRRRSVLPAQGQGGTQQSVGSRWWGFAGQLFAQRHRASQLPHDLKSQRLHTGAQFGGHSFDFRRQRTPCSHTLHHRCGRLQQLPQGC